jgi:hypothetical protein
LIFDLGLLGAKALLLFDGLQSTRDNPNVLEDDGDVIASIAKNKGERVLAMKVWVVFESNQS